MYCVKKAVLQKNMPEVYQAVGTEDFFDPRKSYDEKISGKRRSKSDVSRGRGNS